MRFAELAALAEIFNGKTPSRSEQRNSGHPVLKIRDVDSFGKFRGKFESFVDESIAVKYRAKWAVPGDTVILNAAHNVSHVASKTAILDEGVAGSLLTGEWLIVRPGPDVDAYFLHHWLTSPPVRSIMKDLVKGIHLYPKDVGSLVVPLPNVAEQARVAAILSRAERIHSVRRRVRACLDELESAQFEATFVDRTHPHRMLGEHVRHQRAGLDRRAADQGMGRAFDYVKMDAITSHGRVDLSALTRVDASPDEVEKYSLADGDLLVNTRNSKELVGKTAVYRGGPRLYNNNIMRIRFDDDLLPDYVNRYLWSRGGRAQLEARKSGTTSVFAMYAKSFATIELPVPPRSAQEEFATVLAAIDRKRRGAEAALAAHERLYASLQSQAFRGEL